MAKLKPPVATEKRTVRNIHGHEVVDEYDWLRDPGYPEVTEPEILKYLKAENAYTERVLAPHQTMLDSLYEELKGRIKEDDEGVPVNEGNYAYWWKFDLGAQYRTWLRKPIGAGNEEGSIILDEEALAKGTDFFRVRSFSVSPNERLLAWSEDTDGSERYAIKVKELLSGKIVDQVISGSYGAMVWAEDGKHLIYVDLNENLRPFRVLVHKIGTPQTEDRTIFEEEDASFFVSISKTRDKAYILISAGDHVTNEVRFMPADSVTAALQLIEPRKTEHQYSVSHANGAFFILTNDTHRNFRLVTARPSASGQQNWQELVAGSDETYITGLSCFKDFMVLSERVGGLEQIEILQYDLSGHRIEFPEEAYSVGLGENPAFETGKLRLHYTSMVTPSSTLVYDVSSKDLATLKVQEIPSGYNADDYVTRRIIAKSDDGALVPISVLHRKDYPLDGSGPLFLYGYGSYGLGMDPSFVSARLSIVDRGFAFAIAHIRGGDEMGFHWYEDGKLEKKKNTFTDFIASAECLIAEGYGSVGQIAIRGGSAGGMLVGAVMNMRPDLFRTVVAEVPFVDVLNTMLDDSLPLTPIEFPEWGNPSEDVGAFNYIKSYSPYDNLEARDYPNVFATGGIADPRVTYWEPAKFVARLRKVKTDNNLVMLKTNMSAGHGGASGRFDQLKETAEQYVFVLKTFDMLN